MKVYLRRNEATLASVELPEGCSAVFVGRSRDCALRAPSDESSISGKHGRIFWKGSKLFIEDAGSRNGIFYAGEQLTKPCRMRPGDLFAIGNCQLVVEKMLKDAGDSAKHCHRLEYLNGDNAGKMVDIRPREGHDGFTIGLDPGCDINLPDVLVSRHHAVIRVHEDGECWIEDLGSRNGTYVHGDKLCGKKRLLRDGDKITVAYFDFRFLDRRYRHTRVHVWVKLAAAALTACAVAAVYVAWMTFLPPIEEYLKKTREQAASGDFAQAKETLRASRSARGAGKLSKQIDALAAQLDLWEKTRKDWNAVCRNLSQGSFQAARTTLDRLNAGPLDTWSWNAGNAADAQREAKFAGTALRLYYSGREAVTGAEGGAKLGADISVRSIIAPIEEFLAKAEPAMLEREYIQPLVKNLREMLGEIKVICSGFDRIDSSLDRISSKEPDFRPVLSEFDRLSADKTQPSAVLEYLRQQLDPCRAFVTAQEFLEKEFKSLANLDFDAVKNVAGDLKLPDSEICGNKTKYSDARASMLARHEEIQKEAVALKTLVDGLAASGVTTTSRGEAVDAFMTDGNWEKALSFDCFEKAPPSPRRKEPSGVYDELLGIEHTYESLKTLPNTYNGRSMRMVGFTPKCITARQAFEKAELFVQYLDNADKKYLQRGEIGKYYTQCIKIAIDREKMVSMLKTYKGPNRSRIVAAFYAEFFTPRPDTTAKRAIESQFKSLTREIIELGDDYIKETEPEKQIEIRNRMLKTGLPGDPILHPKWVQKFFFANKSVSVNMSIYNTHLYGNRTGIVAKAGY